MSRKKTHVPDHLVNIEDFTEEVVVEEKAEDKNEAEENDKKENEMEIEKDIRIFEKLENVFHEDVVAIEKQKGDYFPLMKATNRYEDHCVHWGQWVKDHRT
jgi:hypothetical protein